MSAKDRPTSKPMNQQFADNYDKIFGKKVKRPEPSNLGHKHWSPSADVEEWDCRKELEK